MKTIKALPARLFTIFPLLSLLLLGSCDREEVMEAPPVSNSSSQFSAADLAILNRTLNLDATPFNYANPNLPTHFTDGELEPLDNTPDDNPVTDMGATLGRVLFYDPQLSANNTISCASCHQQAAGFSDPDRFSKGFQGGLTKRNSMSLINSRYYQGGRFNWDEKAATLEKQVVLPITDHVEMGMDLGELERKLQQLDYYPVLFRNAFGTEQVTSTHLAKALAQFVRAILSYRTKWDEGLVQAGNPRPEEGMPLLPNLNTKERLGQDIFFNGRKGATCLYCHGTAALVAPEGETEGFTDFAKNNGLALLYQDKGKGALTGNPAENGKFKVPSLRNVALTAPYMHDGRFQTLEEVVDHYSDGVVQHPNLHFRLSIVDDGPPGGIPMKLELTQAEKEALVAFLHTFTDDKLTRDPKYSDPFR